MYIIVYIISGLVPTAKYINEPINSLYMWIQLLIYFSLSYIHLVQQMFSYFYIYFYFLLKFLLKLNLFMILLFFITALNLLITMFSLSTIRTTEARFNLKYIQCVFKSYIFVFVTFRIYF